MSMPSRTLHNSTVEQEEDAVADGNLRVAKLEVDEAEQQANEEGNEQLDLLRERTTALRQPMGMTAPRECLHGRQAGCGN